MVAFVFGFGAKLVALRKESVDRNRISRYLVGVYPWSLSARRAWIEIAATSRKPFCSRVALRKESVDRNDSRV